MTLRDLRKQNGKKAEYVAQRLNVTPTAYYRYENGKREPSLIQILGLAEIFDESPETIIKACLTSDYLRLLK